MSTNPYWTRNDALGAALFDHALKALEPNRNRVRSYSGDPAVDRFMRQIDRDIDARDREAAAEDANERALGGRSLEQWCEDEMGYHGDRR